MPQVLSSRRPVAQLAPPCSDYMCRLLPLPSAAWVAPAQHAFACFIAPAGSLSPASGVLVIHLHWPLFTVLLFLACFFSGLQCTPQLLSVKPVIITTSMFAFAVVFSVSFKFRMLRTSPVPGVPHVNMVYGAPAKPLAPWAQRKQLHRDAHHRKRRALYLFLDQARSCLPCGAICLWGNTPCNVSNSYLMQLTSHSISSRKPDDALRPCTRGFENSVQGAQRWFPEGMA